MSDINITDLSEFTCLEDSKMLLEGKWIILFAAKWSGPDMMTLEQLKSAKSFLAQFYNIGLRYLIQVQID